MERTLTFTSESGVEDIVRPVAMPDDSCKFTDIIRSKTFERICAITDERPTGMKLG